MVRRRTLDREIYAGLVRALAEGDDRNVPSSSRPRSRRRRRRDRDAQRGVLLQDPTLGAAARRSSPRAVSRTSRSAPRSRACVAASRTARTCSPLAPMIKESHRIALCVELFVPLARSAPVPTAIASRARRAPRGGASPRSLARARRGRDEGRRSRTRSTRRAERRGRSVERARGVVARRLGARGQRGSRARRHRAPRPPPTDASHGRARRAPLGSTERRSRHDVPLPPGARQAPGAQADARGAREGRSPLADEIVAARGDAPRARPRARRPARELLVDRAAARARRASAASRPPRSGTSGERDEARDRCRTSS